MKYRLVIFDFDGTLADSLPWFLRSIDSVADRFRFRRLGDGDVELLRGRGAREIIRYLGIPAWKLPFIARHMRRLKARDRDEVSLFPGVDSLLEHLSATGVRLALVSSNASGNVRHILGPANSARIQHWECGTSIFGKKRRFRRVLRRAGVRPEEALCVGDEIRDAEAARAAGIPFGAVAWGYSTAEALRRTRPAALFTRMEEIVPLVACAARRP
jgi:phosphoglycolate phosphatase